MSAIIYPTWATNTAEPITQAAHGFSVGQQLAFNGTWVLADANDRALARVATVAEVIDADRILIAFEGTMAWPAHGLTVGTLYYLSESAPGGIQATPPIATGTFQQPCVLALTANRVRLIEYIITQASGSGETIYQATRDYGAGNSITAGQSTLLAINSAPNSTGTDFTLPVRMSLRGLSGADAQTSLAWYHFTLSYCVTAANYGIQMHAFSRRASNGASNLYLGGSNADANKTYLSANLRGENGAQKLEVTCYIDQRYSRLVPEGVVLGSNSANNIKATWDEADPLMPVINLGELLDVNLTGVS